MGEMMLLSASAAVGADAFKPVLDAMTAQVSVTTVVGVLGAVVAAGIGLVFMWWGVRKLARSLMSAFRSGKLKF